MNEKLAAFFRGRGLRVKFRGGVLSLPKHGEVKIGEIIDVMEEFVEEICSESPNGSTLEDFRKWIVLESGIIVDYNFDTPGVVKFRIPWRISNTASYFSNLPQIPKLEVIGLVGGQIVQKLQKVEGISEIHLEPYFIIITKAPTSKWENFMDSIIAILEDSKPTTT